MRYGRSNTSTFIIIIIIIIIIIVIVVVDIMTIKLSATFDWILHPFLRGGAVG
jgi:hypothetical protein